MTIAEVHNLFYLIYDKEQNGHLPHEEVDNLLHLGSISYFSLLVGNMRQYQPGRPVPPIHDGATGRVSDELNPFRSSVDFMDIPFNLTTARYGVLPEGVLVLPDDIEFMESVDAYVMEDGQLVLKPVHVVTTDEWARRAGSSLIPVSKSTAIAKHIGSGGTVNSVDVGKRKKLRLLPKDVSGQFSYLRSPIKPWFKYILNGRVVTQDVAGSVDLEWGTSATVNIIKRALSLAGVKEESMALLNSMTGMDNKEL